MHFLHQFGRNQFLGRVDLEQPEQCQVMRRCVESTTRFWLKCVGRNCFTRLVSDGYIATRKIEAARSHLKTIKHLVSHKFSEWTFSGSFNHFTENPIGEIGNI